MVTVARVEATITAQNKLRPGLAAAANELARFRDRHSKITKAISSDAARARRVYAEIGEKLESMQGALDTIGRRKAFVGMAGQVDGLRKNLAAIDKIDAFRTASRRLDEMSLAMRQARQEAAKAKAVIAGGKGGPADIAAAERWSGAVERTRKAFLEQGKVTRDARSALADAGIAVRGLSAAEAQLRHNIEAATAAMQKQAASHARSAARREGLGQFAGVAGVAAAYQGHQIGRKAVYSIADFDIAVRKQRAFTDISGADQERLLIPQAKRIGQETQFTNLDIVKAQTAAMQGLPATFTGTLKAEIGAGLIENVKNYALVMEADMQRSAEAIRSYLQTTNQDISTKEKALAAANKATNQLVRMAKLGGMNDEDVQQYLKFAASSGTTAGLSPESLMSVAALARRGGLRGDEAGVFMRTASSKLVAPTKEGIAALNAAGINHSSYVKMPSSLDVDGLEGQFKNSMGLGFQPDTRAKLQGVLSNPAALADRSSFVEAVTAAVEAQFPKTKKGTMRPADRVNVAKAAGKFHQLSASSVDAEGLLDAVMNSSMTLPQLNAFLTDKHGGKGAITQRQRDEYVAARKQLRDTGNDPDFAKKKADEIMGGVGGSFEQAKGALDNFILSVGQANEGLIKFGAEAFSSALGAFEKLSTGGQQAATALGALATAGAGVYGTMKLFGLLTGGGAAGALTGSATALTQSAAALNAAAARLGVSGAAAPAAAAATAAGGWASWLGRAASFAGPLAIGAAAVGGISIIGQANSEKYKGIAPGEPHNEGRNRRRAFHESLQAETRGVKAQVDSLGPAGESAGSTIASGMEAGMARAKASVAAGVAEMQRMLNSLSMPTLTAPRGLGGFNTGKGMREVE